jgi:ABC-type Fe3+/spermidine/putrescine transport system ATPase subunit
VRRRVEAAAAVSPGADRHGSGKLQQIAVPSELYARPTAAFVADFVGTVNQIPGDYGG